MRTFRVRPNGELTRLQQRAAKLAFIEEKIKAKLPAAWHPHIRVLNVADRRLHVGVANAGLGLQLKFKLPWLYRELAATVPGFAKLQGIDYRVLPADRLTPPPPPQRTPRPPRKISAASKVQMREQAKQIGCPVLRAKILKLAR